MLKEAIEKIQTLVAAAIPPNKIQIDDRVYYDKPLYAIQSPKDETVHVRTLTGFSDLVTLWKADGFIHVVSPTLVHLESHNCDEWGRRPLLLICELPPFGAFRFGEYLDQERFHIGLQSFFDQTPADMDYLYKIAGNLTAEQVNTSVDNGISQTVALRMGTVLADKVVAKRIVNLKPWRTFREIEQPSSSFIFRLKNVENNVPLLSLHVGDGEKWQLDAVQAIKTFLKEQHLAISIVA